MVNDPVIFRIWIDNGVLESTMIYNQIPELIVRSQSDDRLLSGSIRDMLALPI